MTEKDRTGRGLVEFLDYAAGRGLMNRNTAGAQKSAVVQVLSIDGDRWLDASLRELDVDQQLARFKNLRKSDYSPASLRTYESRFRTALEEYFRYLDDPSGYKSTTGRPGSAASRNKRGSRAQGSVSNEEVSTRPVPAPPPRDFLITYPFPIRDSVMAFLQLPKDLRRNEAERLTRFVQSLAVDDLSDEV